MRKFNAVFICNAVCGASKLPIGKTSGLSAHRLNPRVGVIKNRIADLKLQVSIR